MTRAHHILFTGFSFPTASEVARYAAAGVKALIVGINDQDDDKRGVEPSDLADGFVWRHGAQGPAKLREALDLCARWNMKLAPMVWARPTNKYCAEAAAAVAPFESHPAFLGVCHDFEIYWHKLIPIADLTGEESAALWLRHFGRSCTRAFITDYATMPAVVGALFRAALNAGVDVYAIPQAYSRHSWLRKGQIYRAGETQKAARRSWGRELADGDDKARLVVGLAAYDLGPQPNAWMRAQLVGATSPDLPHSAQLAPAVAWWSTPAARQGKHLEALLALIQETQASGAPPWEGLPSAPTKLARRALLITDHEAREAVANAGNADAPDVGTPDAQV